MTSENENNALVTIIIPAYNTEQYIHRAIESSIRQTYKNIEIIIIDDGSTDGTLRVAQSYETQDRRVKVIHQENKGVSSARNHGLREANGEYIMFLDSDDWFEDDAVEVLVGAQVKYPDRLISGSKYSVYLDDTRKIINKHAVETNVNDSVCLSIEETIPLIINIDFGALWDKIYKADTISKNNICFREDFYYGEDLIFNFMYIHKTQGLFYMSKPLVNIVHRADSAMRQKCYDNRKLFVDGKFNDWMQFIIDNPENTFEMKKLLKLFRTRNLLAHINSAILSNGSPDRVNQVIEKVRLYLPEYINYHNDMHIIKKLYYYCVLYLPLPIVRTLCKIRVWLRETANKIKTLFTKEEEGGEVIPYW